MNVRSARPASKASCRESVRTAAVGSRRDRSGHRRTGRVTIFWARILRAPVSGTGRLTLRCMRSSRHRSGISHRRNDDGAVVDIAATGESAGANGGGHGDLRLRRSQVPHHFRRKLLPASSESTVNPRPRNASASSARWTGLSGAGLKSRQESRQLSAPRSALCDTVARAFRS